MHAKCAGFFRLCCSRCRRSLARCPRTLFVSSNSPGCVCMWDGIAVSCQTKFMFAHQRCKAKTKNRWLCKVEATRPTRFCQFIRCFLLLLPSRSRCSWLSSCPYAHVYYTLEYGVSDCCRTNAGVSQIVDSPTTMRYARRICRVENGALASPVMDSTIMADKPSIVIMARQLNYWCTQKCWFSCRCDGGCKRVVQSWAHNHSWQMK